MLDNIFYSHREKIRHSLPWIGRKHCLHKLLCVSRTAGHGICSRLQHGLQNSYPCLTVVTASPGMNAKLEVPMFWDWFSAR